MNKKSKQEVSESETANRHRTILIVIMSVGVLVPMILALLRILGHI